MQFCRRFTFLTQTAAPWAAIFATLVMLLAPAACPAQWWCDAAEADCGAACTDSGCDDESTPAPTDDAQACGEQCVCLSICKTPVLSSVRADAAEELALLPIAPLPCRCDLPVGFAHESIEPPWELA